MSEGFVLVHMHRESEKDNLAESRQKSGRQKWLSCTVVGLTDHVKHNRLIVLEMSEIHFFRNLSCIQRANT